MPKLTKRSVEGFECQEGKGQAFLWDGELRGFGVRATAGGGKSYIVQGRVRGKSRRVTIGSHGVWTCEEARKEARERLRDMDRNIDPRDVKQREKVLGVTLREVMQSYLSNRTLRPASKADIEKHVTRNLSAWADKPVAAITRQMVADRFKEMSSYGPAQANLCFRYLRALLNYARERYRTANGEPTLPENPVAVLSGMKVWNKERARTGRIPNHKVGDVWAMLQERRNSDLHPPAHGTSADVVAFLMLTGARWSEAAQLTWDRVNLEEGWWYLPNPKNHNPVTLPLSVVACEILAERRGNARENNDYVFPARNRRGGHIQDVRGTMEKVSEVAGLHLHPHDMRRTFTSIAGECGVQFEYIELLTNHVPKTVTLKHYTETSDLRYLRPQVQLIGDWIINKHEESLK